MGFAFAIILLYTVLGNCVCNAYLPVFMLHGIDSNEDDFKLMEALIKVGEATLIVHTYSRH
jgi:hypothetical protein